MRALSNKSASYLWMKERRFVVRSQEGVKEHAHQINFPAKPQKTQCCVIQGNGADSPPPPAMQLRARGAAVFTPDCHDTRSASTHNYWNRFRWKREMPRDLPQVRVLHFHQIHRQRITHTPDRRRDMGTRLQGAGEEYKRNAWEISTIREKYMISRNVKGRKKGCRWQKD